MACAKFARAWLVSMLFVLAAPAYSLPRIQLYPVELIGYVGKALKIGVEIPCGGSFYGLVASVERKGELTIAAAVTQDTILCAGLPQIEEVTIDYLATTAFKTITPMDTEVGPGKILVARIDELRLDEQNGGRTKLTALYEPRCGETVGTLIRQPSARHLELAFIERTGFTASSSCDSQAKARPITSIDLRRDVQVTTLRDRPKSLNRMYELRIAAIRPDSFVVGKDAAVSAAYWRACNEAPIGLVLGGQARDAKGAPVTRLGVLVARYYNMACPTGAPQAAWTQITEGGLTLPRNSRLEPMAASTAADWSLKTPSAVAAHSKTGASGLDVRYYAQCESSAFPVYGRDRTGGLAVGVLVQEAANGASPCRKLSREVSLFQPYAVDTATGGGMHPMKLKGQQPAH